ncbi:hypothetical protein QL285_008096 [Trifolium repens]|nr:hypothetical protein QL285_008096 [Trifolium repens]
MRFLLRLRNVWIRNLIRIGIVQNRMPPRRAPTAPMTDNVDINQMAYAMHTMAAAVTAQSHAKTQRDLEKREREILAAGSKLLSNFNHQTPPKFNGEGGPETADLWLQSVERIFGAIHCPEGEKVVLATYQLLGGSEYWWRNTGLIMEKRALIVRGTNRDFKVGSDNILRCQGRVCVPDAMDLRNTILGEAHKSKLSIHPGATKMYQDLRQDFWWPGMKRDVAEFVASCLTCQKAKVEHQRPAGMLQSLDIPEWKWDSISMDFITGLPKTRRKHDSIWVIVDRLTKSAHFLPVRITDTAAKLTDIYIAEIVRLHGIPSSIVSDRDPKFTSHFWKTLHEALGTKLRLSSAYHPQTDGQTERTNQSLEDLLRACVLDDRGSWDDVLPLIEFTYNNSFHASIGMAPYEALYGRRCQTPLCWYQDGESMIVGPEMVQQTTDKVRKIRAMMKVAQDRQKSYADRRRRPLEFEEGDHVFLRVTPTTGVGRALKAKKLTPKFIGPYQILERIGKVAYRIALPPVLSLIHDVFHVSQLRKYTPDPSHVITPDDIQLRDNLSFEVPPIKIADKKMKRLRTKEIPLVKVIWNEATGDTTWELESKMKELYPSLFDDV